jgi:predicted transcriptional regulator
VKLSDILKYTDSRIVTRNSQNEREIEKGFSSDLMSDVLTLDEDNILLITGLANVQLVRTAEMADISAVLLARGKEASPEMIELANETGLVIMETPLSLYKASGVLYSKGLRAIY